MPENTDPLRAFIALDLGAGAKAAVIELQSALARTVPRGSVRWTKPDQLHLTLRFLGNVSASQLPELIRAVTAALHGAVPFRLRLEGLGAFPSLGAPRIIWVGLAGDLPALAEVQNRIAHGAASFGDHVESRAFHPHLTLGRVSEAGSRVARAISDLPGGRRLLPPCEWEVTNLRLVRSRLLSGGAEYSDLASFALA